MQRLQLQAQKAFLQSHYRQVQALEVAARNIGHPGGQALPAIARSDCTDSLTCAAPRKAQPAAALSGLTARARSG